MEKDDMVIFIAVEGDRIISSCMACIFHTAPLPSCPTGVCAELLNVYTVQGCRRRGHAEKLVRMLIKEAGRLGVGKILLDATQMGRPLYEKLGFVPLSDQMQLKLQGDYLEIPEHAEAANEKTGNVTTVNQETGTDGNKVIR